MNSIITTVGTLERLLPVKVCKPKTLMNNSVEYITNN